MEILVALVAGFIAALVLWWKSSVSGRPPGPWGLPVVGYLPFLTRKPHLAAIRLAKKYGNIFSMRLGFINTVIINDFQSTKDVFSQDAFLGRPPTPFELNKETMETGAIYGIQWKEHRRNCLHMLRDLGLGKTKMEEHIQEEIRELLEHFETNVDRPFCMRTLLASSMSNNIASLVFGKRLKYNDPVRQMLTGTLNRMIAESVKVAWLIVFPGVEKYLKLLGIGIAGRMSKVLLEMRNYIMKEINEHEETLNPDNIRDFIDGYLLEIQKRKNEPSFNKFVLQDLVAAFFVAGSETVRMTVEWLVLTAASDQKAQRRIQDEIRETVGQNRFAIWSDHKSMPYTHAFMLEVMRWRTLIPMTLLSTLYDTELNGYFIPKNTYIMANLWAIHHDPKHWGLDADDFRPERFLTEDEKEVKKHECNIPFSIGKRSCPGEPLAKVEVFLYFVSILQRFNVSMPEGKVADLEEALGMGLQIKEQELVLTKRE